MSSGNGRVEGLLLFKRRGPWFFCKDHVTPRNWVKLNSPRPITDLIVDQPERSKSPFEPFTHGSFMGSIERGRTLWRLFPRIGVQEGTGFREACRVPNQHVSPMISRRVEPQPLSMEPSERSNFTFYVRYWGEWQSASERPGNIVPDGHRDCASDCNANVMFEAFRSSGAASLAAAKFTVGRDHRDDNSTDVISSLSKTLSSVGYCRMAKDCALMLATSTFLASVEKVIGEDDHGAVQITSSSRESLRVDCCCMGQDQAHGASIWMFPVRASSELRCAGTVAVV